MDWVFFVTSIISNSVMCYPKLHFSGDHRERSFLLLYLSLIIRIHYFVSSKPRFYFCGFFFVLNKTMQYKYNNFTVANHRNCIL